MDEWQKNHQSAPDGGLEEKLKGEEFRM